MENLIKIKHTNVKCEPAAPDTDDFAPVLEDLELICASARIDAVTASITKLSRSKAVELFRTQKIFVNGKCMENNSYALKPDDILVIRGTGKFIYKGCGNETRKAGLCPPAKIRVTFPAVYCFIILFYYPVTACSYFCSDALCQCLLPLLQTMHQQQTGPDICCISSLHRCICFFNCCIGIFCL